MGVLPICVSNPIELKAGLSLFSVSINTPSSRRCEASVTFDDSEFLPVTFSFPTDCVGPFQASFAIPQGAPNGGAYISWQCSGQSPMCNRVQITGGQADPNLSLQETGQISCMTQPQPTTLTTITRTTLGTTQNDKTNAPRDTQTTISATDPATTATATTLLTAGTLTNLPNTATGTATHGPTEGVTGTITGGATANSVPSGDTTNGAATTRPDVTTTMIATILVTKTITSMATLPCTSK